MRRARTLTKARQEDEERADFQLVQLQHFRDQFGERVNQILDLPPLKEIPERHDALLLKLDEIISLGIRRRENEPIIRLTLQLTKSAAKQIEELIKHLAKIDIKQMELILSISQAMFPKGFPEQMTFLGVLHVLEHAKNLLLTAYTSTEIATTIVDLPKGRGRPRSPYTGLAWQLTELWELTTSPPASDDAPLVLIKRVPAPKKIKVSGDQYIIKQPSTEFVGIALRMVEPNITDAQVVTAIKHALVVRKRFYKLITNGLPHTLVGRLQALAKHPEHRSKRAHSKKKRVRKINT